jgi:transcriptional regulator with XRE-family HTH domain
LDQVSDILKKVRESKGWNKSQMARALRVSSQLYGQYESGKKKPGAELFINWKQHFKTDLLETKVSHETPEETFETTNESRRSLEKTIEYLSRDKIKTTDLIDKINEDRMKSTAIIERLVTLMEIKIAGGIATPEAPIEKLREKQKKASSEKH